MGFTERKNGNLLCLNQQCVIKFDGVGNKSTFEGLVHDPKELAGRIYRSYGDHVKLGRVKKEKQPDMLREVSWTARSPGWVK